MRLPEQASDVIPLEKGGEFRVKHEVEYPEWAKYFDGKSRCDRCWEDKGRYTSRNGSDRWLCRACNYRRLNNKDNGALHILKRKVNAQVRRIWWNFKHEERFQIPNRTGHR